MSEHLGGWFPAGDQSAPVDTKAYGVNHDYFATTKVVDDTSGLAWNLLKGGTLHEILQATLDRGDIMLAKEAAKPPVSSALEALYPANPFIREEDYGAAPIVSGRRLTPITTVELSEHYKPGKMSGLEVAQLVDRAQRGVGEWFEFWSGVPFGADGGNHPQNPQQWRRAYDLLRAEPPKLLKQFDYHLKQKYLNTDLSEEALHRLSLSYQALLPYALLKLAQTTISDSLPNKSEAIAQDLRNYSLKPSEVKGHQRISHDTQDEELLYGNAHAMFMIISGAFDNVNNGNIIRMVELSMQNHLEARRSQADAFGLSADFRIDEAITHTVALSQLLGAKLGFVRSMCEKFARKPASKPELQVLGEAPLNPIFQRLSDQYERRSAGQPKRISRTERAKLLMELQITLQSRALLEGLKSNAFSLDELQPLQDSTYSKPLGLQAERVKDIREIPQFWEVAWPIAPTHKGLRGPRAEAETRPRRRRQTKSNEERYDERRIDFLIRLVKACPTKGGLVVRSKIPNLSAPDQYYVALLPRVLAEREVVWDGVGDHPEIGKHAMLLWLAESGMNQHGQVVRSWDTVYRRYKDHMHKIGVVTMKHTATTPKRLRKFLEQPRDKVRRIETYPYVKPDEPVESPLAEKVSE